MQHGTFSTLLLQNRCRAGEYHKAAELLYISQPALSKAIAKLEKSLDVTLFERRKGRISLSAMGRVYYEYVSSAFQVLETGEKKLEEMKQTSAETVSIASPVAGVLQELIYNFLLSGDLIQINQYFYEEHILESELLSGKLDFAVTPVTIENSEIEQTSSWRKKYSLYSVKIIRWQKSNISSWLISRITTFW